MRLICCTANQTNVNENVPTWRATAECYHALTIIADGAYISPPDNKPSICRTWHLPEKRGPVGCLQAGYELSGDADILAYIHDDVQIYERGWDTRVLREFDDPTVAVVGFGGGTGLGTPGIYKTPYRLQQLARSNYMSNVRDAEVHGARFTGERDVAVLDGFCLIVRKSFLDLIGGWPTNKLMFHMYDAFVCCMARRHGYRVRLVGVDCMHFGGRTSTQRPYNEWLSDKFGKTDSDVHREAHEWCYEEFRDVLPFDVVNHPTVGPSADQWAQSLLNQK